MSIVDYCQNFRGALNPEQRQLVQRMLSRPDRSTWCRARRLIISLAPLQTLEMAVEAIAPPWADATPDPFTVYRALHTAVARQEQCLSQCLDGDFDGY